MNSEWKSRTAFAEIAEALEIDTDQVMAALPLDGGQGWLVLYTPDDWVHRALLGRDPDNVLRRWKHARVCPLDDFMEQANEEIGRRLEEELGEPDNG